MDMEVLSDNVTWKGKMSMAHYCHPLEYKEGNIFKIIVVITCSCFFEVKRHIVKSGIRLSEELTHKYH